MSAPSGLVFPGIIAPIRCVAEIRSERDACSAPDRDAVKNRRADDDDIPRLVVA
jgi:hypothetical protein